MATNLVATNLMATIGYLEKAPAMPTKVDGLLTVAWSTLHGRGIASNIFAALLKSWGHGDEVLELVFNDLPWACLAIANGVLPRADWHGRTLEHGGRQSRTLGIASDRTKVKYLGPLKSDMGNLLLKLNIAFDNTKLASATDERDNVYSELSEQSEWFTRMIKKKTRSKDMVV